MGDHSIIPPSSAHIWGAPNGCTGWVLMSQQYPETGENIEALEGEAAHELGQVLIWRASRGENGSLLSEFVDTTSSNGTILNSDMFDAAKIYADDVRSVMIDCKIFGGNALQVEQKIHAKKIHDLSYGTSDCFLFDEKSGHLFIWDFKFGFEVVEVFENWQLLNYVAGIIEQLNISDQNITVHFRIVQPRAFHRDGVIREWTTNGSLLRGYFNILESNANKALSVNAECNTGPHCRHCTARHVCSAALKTGMLLFETASKPTPVELSPTAMGVQLSIIKRARKQLEYLESGFEQVLKNSIKSGMNIPNWMIEQSKGRERWTKPTDEIIALGDIMGHDLRKPNNVITPAQARKMGIDESVIASYSETPFNGVKLVEYNGLKAKQLFGDI